LLKIHAEIFYMWWIWSYFLFVLHSKM
jgi:hypothetical protein